MNEIMIQGTSIQLKEYKGKRVVTFKDIDTVHQRPIGTAKRNFNQNRNRFISGVDFFKMSANEFRTHYDSSHSKQAVESVTLITETGYLMLVKSFTDDLAWKVQRELVDTYFRVRDEPQVVEQTVTVTEANPVLNPELMIRASEAMSGCLEGNRPYVLNILRHIIPDIGELPLEETTTEVTVAAPVPSKDKRNPRFIKEGVDIDIKKLLLELGNQGLTVEVVARRAQVCVTTVSGWIAGKHKPVLQNRINLCKALGKDEDFLTPRRERRKR